MQVPAIIQNHTNPNSPSFGSNIASKNSSPSSGTIFRKKSSKDVAPGAALATTTVEVLALGSSQYLYTATGASTNAGDDVGERTGERAVVRVSSLCSQRNVDGDSDSMHTSETRQNTAELPHFWNLVPSLR